jgi:hypothetical protein
VTGADDLMAYGEDASHDVHCRHCGSPTWSVVGEGAWVQVSMGTLHDTPTVRPTAHILVGSRAPWHEITDDLPQEQTF